MSSTSLVPSPFAWIVFSIVILIAGAIVLTTAVIVMFLIMADFQHVFRRRLPQVEVAVEEGVPESIGDLIPGWLERQRLIHAALGDL